MSSDYATPESLINELISLKNTRFEPGSSEYSSLTDFVKEISKKHRCPLQAYLTGPSRTVQCFKCRYGGKIRSINTVKTNCPCYVNFIREKDGSYSFKDAFWNHNHKTKREYFECHFNTLTKEEKNGVIQQQQLKVPPCQIRTNLDVFVNKDIFYEIRRDEIQKSKRETLEKFKEVCRSPDYSNQYELSRDQRLKSCSFVNKSVVEESYSYDTLIIDDTSGTNIYDLPLLVLFTVDAENKTQIIGFSLLEDKTEESFEKFLQFIKQHLQNDPRVITCDRCQAQINAIEHVFPNTFIVYCRIHIRRNLLIYFEKNDDIIVGFDDIATNLNRCNEYVELLRKRLSQLDSDDEGYIILDTLLNNLDRWLPSRLIELGIYSEWTSNRAEGFFGNFKIKFGFSRKSASELCKNLMTYIKLMKVQSLKSISTTNKHYETFPLFTDEERKQIGALALRYIADEYIAVINDVNNEPWCPWCSLKQMGSSLSLPCRHVMHEMEEISLSLEDIDERYLRIERNTSDHLLNCSEEIIINNDSKKDCSYSWSTRISPWASAAQKSQEVMDVFDRTFNDFQQIGQEINSGMPPTLSIKGKIASHPSHNVILAGAPKTKRLYRCSKWGLYQNFHFFSGQYQNFQLKKK